MPFTEVDLFNRALSRVGQPRLTVQTAKATTGATAANPIVVTCTAHGFLDGDYVLFTNYDMMTQINGRVFQITSVTTNTFALLDEDGSTYTAETGGNVAKITTIKALQVAFDAWKGPAGDGVRDEVLQMHPWKSVTTRTRLARLAAAKTITGATAANPVMITSAAHGYATNDFVKLENLGGMVEVNDRFFSITVLTANTFSIGVDGTAFTAYTSGGTAKKALTPLKPDFTWGARYTLPSDLLAVVALEAPTDKQDYVVERTELLTDVGITAPVRYIRREKDPTAFDALLVSALEARLAVELCEELTQSNSKMEALQAAFDDILRKAKASSARQQSPGEPEESTWITARA